MPKSKEIKSTKEQQTSITLEDKDYQYEVCVYEKIATEKGTISKKKRLLYRNHKKNIDIPNLLIKRLSITKSKGGKKETQISTKLQSNHSQYDTVFVKAVPKESQKKDQDINIQNEEGLSAGMVNERECTDMDEILSTFDKIKSNSDV
ncbi:hypothetical protein V1478_005169 [Vespula squamosa]|uniref:Uncharacterized protein n=1 Tax=Vespula squamosa TaxID=30214 RepID=A0ABD2BDD3_VESSQ